MYTKANYIKQKVYYFQEKLFRFEGKSFSIYLQLPWIQRATQSKIMFRLKLILFALFHILKIYI